MAKRASKADSGVSLDSLMDTLTNVVGILIIILILVQINVAQSLRKIISELPEVSAEEFQEIQQDAETQAEEHAEMQIMIEQAREQVERDTREMTELQPQLAAVETAIEQSDVPLLELDKLLAQLEETRPLVEALREEVDELMEERQRLQALLEQTPDAEPPAPEIVRIPESRPIPENAIFHRYLIHEGRIFSMDLEEALSSIMEEMRRSGRRLEYEQVRQDDGTRKTIYDQEKVVEHFERRNLVVGDGRVVVLPNPQGIHLRFRLEPIEGGGEPIKEAEDLLSSFRRQLREYRDRRDVVWFLVLRDQFAEYLAAREIVDRADNAAGWDVVNNPVQTGVIRDFEVNRLEEPPPPPPPRPTPTPDPDEIHIPAPTRQLD